MNDTIHFTRGPVILKYTGDGDEETDRDFMFYDSSIAPLVVDAGSSGSLAVNGAFRHNSTGYVQHRVTFAGSNPSAVCVASNKFTSITDPDSGEKCSFFVRKSGTGTWRFADRSADNALSGVVGVDGGTLEFDTIRNIGGQCSLGDATALYEDKGGAIAEMSKVPYAHFIGGGDSDATFSYVGSHVAYMEDRPIAVSGRGRLQAGNSKAFAWKRFMGAGSGEKRIAYVCAAGQTNLVANVTDANGGAQGTLSVVKEGPGDLVLSGDLSFGGDLVAQGGGTLTVRDISGERYEYYRLVLKETAAVSSLPEYAHLHVYTTTSNSKQNDSRRVSLCEFGLYNSSGGRLNTYANTSTNSSVVTMQPKQIALQDDWPIVFYAQNNLNTIKHVGFLTDASTTSGAFFEMRWKDNTKYLNLDDPTTWVKIVVRLPKADAGAASFDLNYVYAYTNAVDGATSSQPTAFSIEGSVNGLNWSELYSTNKVVFKSPN